VRFISAAETIPLRHTILRAGKPIETATFTGDDAPTTKHLGAFRNNQLLGVASLYIVELPERPAVPALQLRGMATAQHARQSGLGRALVMACIAVARSEKVQLLWCNARISASAFYAKMGFTILGDEFEIPDVGPHYRMLLSLT